MPEAGWVFNIQRFSLHDGPGIRTTVFMKGCPLRCLWCHNPEGLESRPQVRLTSSLCTHCGRCAEACEHGGHTVTPESHDLHLEGCVRCGQCVEACYAGAVEMVGSRMTTEEAMAVVRRDVPFYDQSKGGMTLSGGEPMAQFAFTREMLQTARAEAIGTAMETSAFCPWERLEELLPLCDLLMVDLKHTDDARHRELIGVSNAPILANLTRLSEAGIPLIVRTPWIPGRNVEEGFLQGLIDFVGGLPKKPPIEFMPYHRLGLSKWESLGSDATMDHDTPAATKADVQPWIDRCAQAGLEATIR